MKVIFCAVFVLFASTALEAKDEISFVSPTISRVITDAIENRILEEELKAIIECFRKVLLAGLPEHGIPSFSPLEMPELKIDLDSLGIPGATGFINFETLLLDGLMGFDPTHIQIVPLISGGLGAEVQLTLMFDSIDFKSDYDTDLTISEIHLFGNGDVKLDVTKLQLEVVLQMRLSAPNPMERIYLESMKFLPSVENVHIEFKGLFGDTVQNDLVNEILNSILTNWVNEKGQDISNLIESIIKDIINNPQTGEHVQLNETPNIIEIILNECKEPPINDCENPSGITQTIACTIVTTLEEIRAALRLLDPLLLSDVIINLDEIGFGTGLWTLETVKLEDYSNFELGKVEAKMGIWSGVGIVLDLNIPLSWKNIVLDVTQNGEIEILGMKISSEQSRCIGFLQNFNFTVYAAFRTTIPPTLYTLSLIPEVSENDIKGVCSSIYINGENASNMITNFINNDLAKFLSQHGEDIGDIISGIIMKIFIANRPPLANSLPVPFNEIFEKVTTAIQKTVVDMNL